ncbi:MAG: prolipoprotein diacylglyceryl transferase [Aerococcaceae bacterium]|nr:prolipoprotein diacylglyceryl transferase [Aerococcaceae bacterium]
MGLFLRLDPVAFRVFGWPVQWYGLIIGLGMVVAYQLLRYLGRKHDLSEEVLIDVMFWTVLFGLVGARAYYVAFRWDYYQQHLDEIPAIWQGGIAIYGGILAGIVTLVYLCHRYRLDVRVILDCAAPAVMIGQSIGRWGNFVNQEAYGGATTLAFLQSLRLPKWLIDQMNVNGTYYHPTFLYESVWNIVGVVMLLSVRHFLKKGELAALYMIWYGIGRFWIEGMRTDSLYLGSLRVSQLVSLVFLIIGISYIAFQRLQKKEG